MDTNSLYDKSVRVGIPKDAELKRVQFNNEKGEPYATCIVADLGFDVENEPSVFSAKEIMQEYSKMEYQYSCSRYLVLSVDELNEKNSHLYGVMPIDEIMYPGNIVVSNVHFSVNEHVVNAISKYSSGFREAVDDFSNSINVTLNDNLCARNRVVAEEYKTSSDLDFRVLSTYKDYLSVVPSTIEFSELSEAEHAKAQELFNEYLARPKVYRVDGMTNGNPYYDFDAQHYTVDETVIPHEETFDSIIEAKKWLVDNHPDELLGARFYQDGSRYGEKDVIVSNKQILANTDEFEDILSSTYKNEDLYKMVIDSVNAEYEEYMRSKNMDLEHQVVEHSSASLDDIEHSTIESVSVEHEPVDKGFTPKTFESVEPEKTAILVGNCMITPQDENTSRVGLFLAGKSSEEDMGYIYVDNSQLEQRSNTHTTITLGDKDSNVTVYYPENNTKDYVSAGDLADSFNQAKKLYAESSYKNEVLRKGAVIDVPVSCVHESRKGSDYKVVSVLVPDSVSDNHYGSITLDSDFVKKSEDGKSYTVHLDKNRDMNMSVKKGDNFETVNVTGANVAAYNKQELETRFEDYKATLVSINVPNCMLRPHDDKTHMVSLYLNSGSSEYDMRPDGNIYVASNMVEPHNDYTKVVLGKKDDTLMLYNPEDNTKAPVKIGELAESYEKAAKEYRQEHRLARDSRRIDMVSFDVSDKCVHNPKNPDANYKVVSIHVPKSVSDTGYGSVCVSDWRIKDNENKTSTVHFESDKDYKVHVKNGEKSEAIMLSGKKVAKYHEHYLETQRTAKDANVREIMNQFGAEDKSEETSVSTGYSV